MDACLSDGVSYTIMMVTVHVAHDPDLGGSLLVCLLRHFGPYRGLQRAMDAMEKVSLGGEFDEIGFSSNRSIVHAIR